MSRVDDRAWQLYSQELRKNGLRGRKLAEIAAEAYEAAMAFEAARPAGQTKSCGCSQGFNCRCGPGDPERRYTPPGGKDF